VSEQQLKVLLMADAGTFHAARFAVELKRQGCRVLTVSMEPGGLGHFRLKRIGPFRSLHYSLACRQVKRIIKRFQPDLINPHFASGYGFMAALAARGKTPIALNLWGSDILIVPQKSALHRRKTVHALKRAAHVIGDSVYLVDAARKLTPVQHGSVIPWGIEQEYLRLHRTGYELSKPLRVIVPRAHDDVYNNLFIVEALADLIRDGRIVITFPGFGRLLEDFRRHADKLVGDNVRYYEKLPRPEFLKMVSTNDVYLSAASSDSSPVTLIEAMALGLIPVAADIDGVKEWLSPSSGFLFPPGDRGSLNRIIAGLTDSTDDFAAMRRANFERVKSKAIFEKNVAEQISIMKQLAWGEAT